MNKMLALLSIVFLSACGNSTDKQAENIDTLTASVVAPKDTVKPNIGSWTATIKTSPSGKNGKLTVKGNINIDAKAIVKLSKDKSTIEGNPSELRLKLSHEPKNNNQGDSKTVTYVENLSDVNKYDKVIVSYNNSTVSVMPNIERAK